MHMFDHHFLTLTLSNNQMFHRIETNTCSLRGINPTMHGLKALLAARNPDETIQSEAIAAIAVNSCTTVFMKIDLLFLAHFLNKK